MTPGESTSDAAPNRSRNGFLAVIAVVGILAAVGRCADTTPRTPAQAVDAASETLATAVAEQTPRPVDDLSANRVRLGARRVALASVEGLAGEMVYSQNCYDGLGRAFDWNKLDECGGFDVRASLDLDDDVSPGDGTAAAWFDGEAAAGRYLKAATAAGLAADAADERLAALQRRVGPARQARPTPADDIAEPTSVGSGDDAATGTGNDAEETD